jgi:putative hydrolase of the HAD superfamily
MFKAILFDLDGVIRHFDEGETSAIEERHALPVGAIMAAAFEPVLLEQAVCGRIDDATWRLAIRDALTGAHGPAAAAAVADWCALTGSVARDVLDLIGELRPRLRTGLVTNCTTRLESDLEELGVTGSFDALFSSARLGFAKPDARIFRAAAERLGARLDECIFIDDKPAFVEAARALGLAGILFAGADDLRARLDSLLAPEKTSEGDQPT